jgi:dolichol-phosphate mannosyltransferase
VRDLTGGFKCFHRRVLENADLDSVHGQGYVFQIELTYRTLRMGGRVREVPITFCDRKAGTSKMTLGIVSEAVWKVPALRLRGARAARDGELQPGAVASLVASRPPL